MATVNETNGTSHADQEPKNEVATQPKREPPVVVDDGRFSNWLDTKRYEHIQRVAQAFNASSLVPDHFRGKSNLPNCIIAVQMAFRCGVDPMTFLQNCYIVHGRPGIEAKLAIALANSSGVFSSRIKWRFNGEGRSRSCTAYATDRETGEVLETTVDWQMVEAEGWNKKSGSKWLTMPDIMFQYRSAMFLLRLYAPDVLLGMYSADELQDMHTITVTPEPPAVGNAGLRHLLGEKEIEEAAPQSEPAEEPHYEPEPEYAAEQQPPKPKKKPKRKAAEEGPLQDVLAAIEEAQTEAHVREIVTSEPFTLLGGVDALKAAQAADEKAAHLKAKAEGKLL